MSHNHAIVWMDSKEARIFQFNASDVESAHIRAHNPFRQVHHKAGVIGAGHTQVVDRAHPGRPSQRMGGRHQER